MLLDALRQHFAARGRQELGIAQPADAIAGIEDDGSGDYRAEEGAASDLVHPGD